MPENRMYERREFYGYRQQDVADYLGIQRTVLKRTVRIQNRQKGGIVIFNISGNKEK